MNSYQLLGIIAGMISGLVWEFLGTSPFKNIPTITPSFILELSGKSIHIHHWLVYMTILLGIALISLKTGRLLHPSILMIIAFLTAAILYNWFKFPDWHVFVK